jgi:hypothetical protein
LLFLLPAHQFELPGGAHIFKLLGHYSRMAPGNSRKLLPPKLAQLATKHSGDRREAGIGETGAQQLRFEKPFSPATPS